MGWWSSVRGREATPGDVDDQALQPEMWTTSRMRGSRATKVLLLHVPKTGGSSLRLMLESHVPSAETHLSRDADQWMDRTAADLARYRLFVGHTFLEPLYLFPDDRWVTVLAVRQPLAWWRSWYKFVRRQATARREERPDMARTFDEWLAEQPDHALSNPQASWLLARARVMFDNPKLPGGVGSATVPSALVRGGDYAQVLGELVDRTTVVGVTDRLQAVYLELCRVMGWDPAHEKALRRNVSQEPEELLRIGSAQQARLEALNRLDTRLYEQARARSPR